MYLALVSKSVCAVQVLTVPTAVSPTNLWCFANSAWKLWTSLASSVCLVLVPNRKCQLLLNTWLLDLEVKSLSDYLASPDGHTECLYKCHLGSRVDIQYDCRPQYHYLLHMKYWAADTEPGLLVHVVCTVTAIKVYQYNVTNGMCLVELHLLDVTLSTWTFTTVKLLVNCLNLWRYRSLQVCKSQNCIMKVKHISTNHMGVKALLGV